MSLMLCITPNLFMRSLVANPNWQTRLYNVNVVSIKAIKSIKGRMRKGSAD